MELTFEQIIGELYVANRNQKERLVELYKMIQDLEAKEAQPETEQEKDK